MGKRALSSEAHLSQVQQEIEEEIDHLYHDEDTPGYYDQRRAAAGGVSPEIRPGESVEDAIRRLESIHNAERRFPSKEEIEAMKDKDPIAYAEYKKHEGKDVSKTYIERR